MYFFNTIDPHWYTTTKSPFPSPYHQQTTNLLESRFTDECLRSQRSRGWHTGATICVASRLFTNKVSTWLIDPRARTRTDKRHNKTEPVHLDLLRYFEHPVSAPTSAMMTNGNSQTGNPNEDESQENMNNLVTSHQVHQVNNSNGSTTYLYEYYKVPEKDSGSIQWRWVPFRINYSFLQCVVGVFDPNDKRFRYGSLVGAEEDSPHEKVVSVFLLAIQ